VVVVVLEPIQVLETQEILAAQAVAEAHLLAVVLQHQGKDLPGVVAVMVAHFNLAAAEGLAL
jgi:hypothetical protein